MLSFCDSQKMDALPWFSARKPFRFHRSGPPSLATAAIPEAKEALRDREGIRLHNIEHHIGV